MLMRWQNCKQMFGDMHVGESIEITDQYSKFGKIMIEFKRVVCRIIEMPLVKAFETSSDQINQKSLLLLEFMDKSGLSVFSECVARQMPNYTPETLDTAYMVLKKHILPFVLGQSFDHPSHMVDTIRRHIRGHWMAVASVDMAAWAMHAMKQGISLSQAIGGIKSSIDCGISIGIESSPDALVDVVQKEMAEGYKKIKCKIKPGKDVQFMARVRDICGPDVPLMVDANSAYTLNDLDDLKALDDLGLLMMEQPLAWDDMVMHAHLQRKLRTPLCLDESICHAEHAQAAIELGAAKIINIKPGRVGGFTEAINIHDVCQRANIPVWCGGMLESGIGRAYNVALASKLNFTIPGDISPSHRYWFEDIVFPEWDMSKDGQMAVPTSPGLGVEVNKDRIASLCIHEETIHDD